MENSNTVNKQFNAFDVDIHVATLIIINYWKGKNFFFDLILFNFYTLIFHITLIFTTSYKISNILPDL